MKIVKFTFNMFGENCYIVYDPESAQAMVVDPGMLTQNEKQALDDFITKNALSVKYLVNTHLHLDHCFGNDHVSKTYGVTTMAHPADTPLGRDITSQARMFGIFDAETSDISKISPLAEGDVLTLGSGRVEVLNTPGHTPGGISLYLPDDKTVITGDTLFAGGDIGRTDLPGGNYNRLIESIRTKLYTLPPETKVLPGHGPTSTIGSCM